MTCYMYTHSPTHAEMYVSSIPITTFGRFRDVYVGVSRCIENGASNIGDVFVRVNNDWLYVGQMMFEEPPFMPMTNNDWMTVRCSGDMGGRTTTVNAPANEVHRGFVNHRERLHNYIRILQSYNHFLLGYMEGLVNAATQYAEMAVLLAEISTVLQNPWQHPLRVIRLVNELRETILEVMDAVNYISNALDNGELTIAELMVILRDAGIDSAVGDILHLIQNRHMFSLLLRDELTNVQARELGRRYAGAMVEALTAGLVVYTGVKAIGKVFTAVKVIVIAKTGSWSLTFGAIVQTPWVKQNWLNYFSLQRNGVLFQSVRQVQGNQAIYVFRATFFSSASSSATGALAPATVNAMVARYSQIGVVTVVPHATLVGQYVMTIVPHRALVAGVPNGGFGNLSRAYEFGILPYNEMRNRIAGTGLQAHHIIEVRFIRQPSNLTVAVTPAEHQVFTNAWRHYFPLANQAGHIPYGTITNQQLWVVAQIVYANYPAILEAVRIALGV